MAYVTVDMNPEKIFWRNLKAVLNSRGSSTEEDVQSTSRE